MAFNAVQVQGLYRATVGIAVATGALWAGLALRADLVQVAPVVGGAVIGVLLYRLVIGARVELGLIPPAALAHALATLAAAIGWQSDWPLLFDAIIGATAALGLTPLLVWLGQLSGRRLVGALALGVPVGAMMALAGIGLGTLLQTPAAHPWPVAIVLLASAIWSLALLPEFILRFLAWVLGNVVYRFRVNGLANIPRDGAALLVCNHISFIDWLFVGAACDRPIRFVMDRNMFRLPVVKHICTIGNVIPIAPRKLDPALLEVAMERIHEELQNGRVVCIFPEGAITRDGQMGPVRSGVERIVERDPVPVVPMALNGLWGSYFSRIDGAAMKTPLRRGIRNPVELRIGLPIPPEQVSVATVEAGIRALWEGPPDAPPRTADASPVASEASTEAMAGDSQE